MFVVVVVVVVVVFSVFGVVSFRCVVVSCLLCLVCDVCFFVPLATQTYTRASQLVHKMLCAGKRKRR